MSPTHAGYTRIGPISSPRHVTLARLPRCPAEVVRVGTRPASGLVATPTAGQPRTASALQRLCRLLGRLLLAV